MTENLRYGPAYNAQTLPTSLDFTVDANFAGAVEMCNGMGACRKLEGTMCPFVHGHARGGALDAGPGEPVAGGDVGQAARRAP